MSKTSSDPTVSAPFPMNIAIDHLPQNEHYSKAVTYMTSSGMKHNDLPGLNEAMSSIYKQIHSSMNGRKYFMSICPIPYNKPYWYFRERIQAIEVSFSLDRICSLIEKTVIALGVNYNCVLELNIDARKGSPQSRILFRACTVEENGMYKPIGRDEMKMATINISHLHPEIHSLLKWYSECHGLISWHLDQSIDRQPFNINDTGFVWLGCSLPLDHPVYLHLRKQREILPIPKFERGEIIALQP